MRGFGNSKGKTTLRQGARKRDGHVCGMEGGRGKREREGGGREGGTDRERERIIIT